MHIGPPKTATTAIQGALMQARSGMLDHGVVYPGRGRQHAGAAVAVVSRGKRQRQRPPSAAGTPAPKAMRPWRQLVKEVRAAGDRRVVVSSEFFGEADRAAAEQVVAALGGPDVHVVVTLRPLVKLLPSAWQQYVRNRLRTPYRKWLDSLFDPESSGTSRNNFWNRHTHDDLVARWANIVGPDRVTVIMVDENDRLHIMRTFEQLTGLPEGFLVPEPGLGNRSLTHGETELIRRLNVEFVERNWPDSLYQDVVRVGLVRALQARTPDPAEARTMTPQWAIERAAERGARAAENITALGVRVVGDISELASRSVTAGKGEPVSSIPSEAAAQGLLGVVLAAAPGIPSLLPAVEPQQIVELRKVSEVKTGELAGVLGRRVVEIGRRRARRLTSEVHARRTSQTDPIR